MSTELSVPGIVDDRYRLEELLGRGGMGTVYRARDLQLDRLVALKVIRPDLVNEPEARRRFGHEAQMIARLRHPSIVAVYGHGSFAGSGMYLTMEIVQGEDLRQVLEREGRLEPRRALRIVAAVCRAVDAAHREGVLHRDLKPENILLPGGDEVKVLDFGLASVLEEPGGSTASRVIVGTPAYMAPEQFRDGKPDRRTDVFSLGVIAYEMLTGRLPFGPGPLAEVVLAQTRGVPPMAGAPVPPAAERAIRSALAADPDRRPPTPQALAHLLLGASAGMC